MGSANLALRRRGAHGWLNASVHGPRRLLHHLAQLSVAVARFAVARVRRRRRGAVILIRQQQVLHAAAVEGLVTARSTTRSSSQHCTRMGPRAQAYSAVQWVDSVMFAIETCDVYVALGC